MGVSKEAIICGDDILELIPQRVPIVMVDKFYGMDDNISVTGLSICNDNIFSADGFFSECGLIEHIAQSAALRVGYICKQTGKEVPIGFIGSVNKFSLNRNVKIGEDLITEVKVETELMNITLILAKVKVVEDVVAECSMKIFLQE